MSYGLDFGLTVLVWAFIIFLVALGYLLCMCLLELHKSLQNFTEITNICKSETQPIIDEVKDTFVNIKKITAGPITGFNFLKSILSGALGTGALMLSNLKSIKGGFLDGLFSGFKLFKK